jgi:hypothetical protein
MSVRLTAASSHRLGRTTAPDYNSAFTIAGWIYLVADPDDYHNIVKLYGNHATQEVYDRLFINWGDFGTNRLRASYNNDTVNYNVGGPTDLTVATWYHVALLRTSATEGQIILDGVLNATIATNNVSGRLASVSELIFGAFRAPNNGAYSQYLDARLAYWRAWTAALSTTELTSERTSPTPVLTSGLWADWPLTVHTDLNDASGNARHLTATGTLTTEGDPPAVSAGALPGDEGGLLTLPQTAPASVRLW